MRKYYAIKSEIGNVTIDSLNGNAWKLFTFDSKKQCDEFIDEINHPLYFDNRYARKPTSNEVSWLKRRQAKYAIYEIN